MVTSAQELTSMANGAEATSTDRMQNLLWKLAKVESEREMYKDMAQSLKGDVKVLCRVRPTDGVESDEKLVRVLSPKQLEVCKPSVVKRTLGRASRSCSTISRPEENAAQVVFFDHVFGPETTDDAVRDCLRDDIISAIYGHQVCIFAYGATGAGKTHTIDELTRRSIDMIVKEERVAQSRGETLHVRAQMVEVYNENFRDLLAPDTPSSSLKVASSDGNARSVHLQGGVLYSVSNIDGDLKRALQMARANRATSATNIHDRSSRSHLIITLFFSRFSGKRLMNAGKLSLVDLAGSERLKNTSQGPRMKEGQMINKSLAALGDVLWAQERKLHHIPFRNSKLTHLLQDSLGGQMSRTIMIIAVSPSAETAQETVASIVFGSRLNNISLAGCSDRLASTAEQSRLRTLVEQRSSDLARLEEEICSLKTENSELRAKVDSKTQIPPYTVAQKLKRTMEELQRAREQIVSLERTVKAQGPAPDSSTKTKDRQGQRRNKYDDDRPRAGAESAPSIDAVGRRAITPPTTRLDLMSPRREYAPPQRAIPNPVASQLTVASQPLDAPGTPPRELRPIWVTHPIGQHIALSSSYTAVSTPHTFFPMCPRSRSATAHTSAYRSVPPPVSGFWTARVRPYTVDTSQDYVDTSLRIPISEGRHSLPAPTPLRNSASPTKYAVSHISFQDAEKMGYRDIDDAIQIVAGPSEVSSPLMHIKPVSFDKTGFSDTMSQISQSSDGSEIKVRLKHSLPAPKSCISFKSVAPLSFKVRQ